jgi:hypothetical protein
MDRSLIEKYAAGADVPARGISGLTREEMNSFPVPNTWSIQQIIIHLMDSDLIGGDRMKRVIAEDNPLIISYNETRFAERLMYERVDPEAACDLFARHRRLTGDLLRALPEETFERTGVHNEKGKLTLAQFVKIYVEHLDHHMKFLYAKRRALGKPLAKEA